MIKGMWGKITASAMVLAFAAAPLQAAFDKGGVLGVGARPIGMGNAYTAIAEEGIAIHWNPAGLVQVPRMELSGFFGPLLNGKELYFAGGFVLPFMEQTAMGLSLVTLYHDTGSEETQAYENQYKLAFATPLNIQKTVSLGLTLKFLQYDSAAKASFVDPSGTPQTIEAKASALGVDLGFLYQLPLPSLGKKISLGFFAEDLDTVLRWQSGVEERVPLLIRFGAAYWIEENLNISVDYSFFEDRNISGQPLESPLVNPATNEVITTLEPREDRPHVGLEGWFFNDHLGLRTGYTGFATTADRFTAGVSYRQKDYGIDYAYMGHAEHLGDSHRLSAHYVFGSHQERPRVVALVNPPTNIQVDPANNQAHITWDPSPDPHVTGYTIYMSKAPGADYIPIQKAIRDTKVIVDGLTNGTRYYFVVTAVNNSWPAVESTYSREVSVVPAPIIPGAPTLGGEDVRQGPSKDGIYVLKGWGFPTGNIAGYNIYVSEVSGAGYKKMNEQGPVTATSFTIRELEPNKRYFWVLTSVTKDNPPVESRPSHEFNFTAKQEGQLPNQQPQR